MSGLLTLADVDRRDPHFTPEQFDALAATVLHQIGPWVVTLNEWRSANYAPTQDFQTPRSSFSTPASTLGSNDPCPCGSGNGGVELGLLKRRGHHVGALPLIPATGVK